MTRLLVIYTQAPERKSECLELTVKPTTNTQITELHPLSHPPCCPTQRSDLGLTYQVLLTLNHLNWRSSWSLGRNTCLWQIVGPSTDHSLHIMVFCPAPQDTSPTSLLAQSPHILDILQTHRAAVTECPAHMASRQVSTWVLLPPKSISLPSSQKPSASSPAETTTPALIPWLLSKRANATAWVVPWQVDHTAGLLSELSALPKLEGAASGAGPEANL
jgi:hypothetical protein